MSSVREIDIKNYSQYFLDDMRISNKNLDPNNIKIHEKSYKNTLIHCIGYVTSGSVKALYLINKK